MSCQFVSIMNISCNFISLQQSFKNLKDNWSKQIGNDVVKMLIGNKCDLKNERVVSYEEAKVKITIYLHSLITSMKY